MLDIATDVIERAIAVLGAEAITEAEVEAQVLALAGDRMTARRLIDWLREAFALVAVGHVAPGVLLPKTFKAKSRSGQWVQFPFEVEPIFPVAVRIGMDMLHSDGNRIFQNIARSGSSVTVLGQAMSLGKDLAGGTLSGPALIGIPAEVYRPQARPWWRRWLG